MIENLSHKEISEINQRWKKGNDQSYPIGPEASFILSNTYFSILDLSPSASGILDIETGSWRHQTITELFAGLVVQHQQSTTILLFKKSLELLSQCNDVNTVANLECNIKTRDNSARRIMLQYQLLQHDDAKYDRMVIGKFVDITHLVKDGYPKVVVIKDNAVHHLEIPVQEDLLKNDELHITPKELSMLSLKARGMRGKEIAQNLGITLLTVYSMTRDIKQKTKMDIFPLIQKLKEKGLLSLFCGHLIHESILEYSYLL